MKEELLTIFAEFLDVDKAELTDDKTLEDLSIDSLTFIELMFDVEDKYDVDVMTEMQKVSDTLTNLGDVLSTTEELILKYQKSGKI